MDALEFTARHGQVARLLGTAGQQHGVELGHELLGADGFLGPVGDLGVFAQAVLARHQHAGTDLDAFGHELLDAAVDVRLLQDRKSTRLNSSHLVISYAVFCLKKKKKTVTGHPWPYTEFVLDRLYALQNAEASRLTVYLLDVLGLTSVRRAHFLPHMTTVLKLS